MAVVCTVRSRICGLLTVALVDGPDCIVGNEGGGHQPSHCVHRRVVDEWRRVRDPVRHDRHQLCDGLLTSTRTNRNNDNQRQQQAIFIPFSELARPKSAIVKRIIERAFLAHQCLSLHELVGLFSPATEQRVEFVLQVHIVENRLYQHYGAGPPLHC